MSSDTSPRADEQFCNTCGAIIKERAEICPECGVENDPGPGSGGPALQFCESCGEQVRRDAERCPNCGVPQESESSGLDSGDVILYVIGSMFVLGGIDGVLTPGGDGLSGILIGVALIALGLAMFPVVRERLYLGHSLTTFGTVKTVEEYPVSNEAGTCTVCQREVSEGVRREYTEDFALFGVVLSSETGGTNLYCQTCAGTETGPHTHVDLGEATPEETELDRTLETELESDGRDE